MSKWVGIIFVVCGVLMMAVLCTKLNTEQELLKAAKYNAQAAEQRVRTAKVEFINELYRSERYKVLFNDAVHKGDWEVEIEELKKINGYYN